MISRTSLIAIFILVFLDQFSKEVLRAYEGVSFLFFTLKYSVNTGSSFSMFAGVDYYSDFILILSVVVLYLLAYYSCFFLDSAFLKISHLLLVSGILGNAIDRLLFEGVRDIILFSDFFIFNLADFYLNLAVFLLILNELSECKLLKRKKRHIR